MKTTWFILRNKLNIEAKVSNPKVAQEMMLKHGWTIVGQYTLDE